ncbi:SC35-like splicing factor 28 [Perilla frutescens var. frutescens]|nr:SC35-like splicing factor 28 [Perilla frutescens var. frutescens]
MARPRSRSRSRSRSHSPARRKLYDEPRERRRDRRSPAPSGLLVRNISLSSRPEDLRVPFERFGPVKDVYLPKNYFSGEPRGFGFVKFRYPEDAAEAKSHMDRKVIGGREIRIVFAEENRKTPQEMRRVTRTSSRGGHKRRSPSLPPRRRYHSRSHSPYPARHDSRDRGYGARDNRYSRQRSRSLSRSVSPRNDRSYRSCERSPKHSRSLSRSVSPQEQKNHRPSLHSPSPRENGNTGHARSMSQSPRRSSSPARILDNEVSRNDRGCRNWTRWPLAEPKMVKTASSSVRMPRRSKAGRVAPVADDEEEDEEGVVLFLVDGICFG